MALTYEPSTHSSGEYVWNTTSTKRAFQFDLCDGGHILHTSNVAKLHAKLSILYSRKLAVVVISFVYMPFGLMTFVRAIFIRCVCLEKETTITFRVGNLTLLPQSS